ncbi:MAG: SurA N-terminal domain-containing protein [Alphaproteobacteria bacterium]
MLEILRTATAGWVAKGFIGMLVLSFAVWGIADIFTGDSNRDIATVGDTSVSQRAFQTAFQNELNQVAARLGRQLTPDEARAVGLDRRVLSQLLTSAALSNQARSLKLGISDEAIAKNIVEDATFRDSFGRFSRQTFEQVLSYAGLSEEGYVAEQRQRSVRSQLASTISGALAAPAVLRDAFAEFQAATRTVEYFVVPPVDATTIGAASDAALKTYYDDHAGKFTKPEYREFAILPLVPEDLVASIDIDESEIAQEYAARSASYQTLERRQIEQILFADAAKATQAATKIAEGADFAEIAKQAGFSTADISLGLVERSAVVDPAIAQAAFSLDVDKVSDPVKGTFGSALVRVRKIEPAKTRQLDEVRDEITRRLALEKALDEIVAIQNQVEDERAGGLSLAEIANKLNLRHSTVVAMDGQGKNPAGTLVEARFRTPELLRAVFEFQVGEEADPLELPSGAVVWVDVISVTEPALQDFAKVRAQVEKSWLEGQVETRRQDTARQLVERGNAGATLAQLAVDAGSAMQTSQPFARRGAGTPFSSAFAQSAFAVTVDRFVSGTSNDNNALFVARVTKHTGPNAAQVNPALDAIIVTALEADLFAQYVGGLQARFGVSVDGTVLQALTGADPGASRRY